MITILTNNKIKGQLFVHYLKQVAGVENTINAFTKKVHYLNPDQLLIDTTDFKLMDMLKLTAKLNHYNITLLLDPAYPTDALPLFIRTGVRKILYNDNLHNLQTILSRPFTKPMDLVDVCKVIPIHTYFDKTILKDNHYYKGLLDKHIKRNNKLKKPITEEEQKRINQLIKDKIFPNSTVHYNGKVRPRPSKKSKNHLTNTKRYAIIKEKE